jgi:ribonuclease BN (tRNA processing enzyme)
MTDVAGRLRVTVLGCGTALPHPATPAAGFLVEWETTAVLLDAGQGVVRRLQRDHDPRRLAGIVVGHMHADHYLDLVGLRYLFPWADRPDVRLPVHLPPGGTERLEALADAISERPGFFETAFEIDEYQPDLPLAIGPFVLRFQRARHYVPAWGISVEAPDGARIVYTGDTGPSEAMTEFAHGADLLLVEAALMRPDDDDPERGHLTVEEAVGLASRADVRAALLVHYAPDRRAELEAECASAGGWIAPAFAGQRLTVAPRPAQPPRIAGEATV